jgi:hypothetical protein
MTADSQAPSTRRRRAIVFAAVGLVLVAVLALYLWARGGGEGDEVQPASEELHWPLTGLPADVLPERPALVVKVSNSPEARPQTGLEEADVVLEEVTEGGITRFAAVLHSRLPEVIGPVRSARPVDVQIVSGFARPGFAYSGARPEVQRMLAGAPAATITEGDPGFFRDDGRYASHPVAPHDLFLNVEPALDAVQELGARPLVDLGWEFAEQPPAAPADGDEGASVDIEMSRSSTTTWSYDEAAGVYRRQQNGEPSQVTGAGDIGAANVVVLDVRHYVGDSGYPETDVVGSGPGIVLRDGQRHRVTWSKPTAAAPLMLTTPDGETPFPLKPGTSWIHFPDSLPD